MPAVRVDKGNWRSCSDAYSSGGPLSQLPIGHRGHNAWCRACAVLYFVTFDAGGDALDGAACGEADTWVLFKYFFSGML